MWNDLGLSDKARMIQLAVKSGITDLRTIEEVYNTYASGGDIDRNNYGPGGGISIIEPRVVAHSVGNALRGLIPKRLARNISESANSYTGLGNITKGLVSSFTNKDDRERLNYLEEEYPDPGYGFLLDDARQKKYMEGLGYHLVNDSNYGMVNKATQNLMNKTGKVRVPIYQFGDDDIDPSLVELVSVDPDVVSKYHVPTERQLNHASYHPKALYEDTEGNHYVKAWDLNDYGQHNGRIGQKFIDFIQGYNSKQPVIGGGATYGNNQFLAELYDFVGNPFVQRTGLVKVEEPPKTEQETMERLLRAIREFKPNKSDGGNLLNPYADGGGIHIKPSHRGRFTELLKRTGKPASWFKAHGTPAQKKMAVFALNARKWKHEDGGPLEEDNNRSAIGYGNNFDSRMRYLNLDEKLVAYINKVAQDYNISPAILTNRLFHEGAIDKGIKEYDYSVYTKNKIKSLLDYGYNNWDSYNTYGLDDSYSLAREGKLNLRRNIPLENLTTHNETGRWVNPAGTQNPYDSIELMAAVIEYYKNEMSRRFPNLSEKELDTATNMAYNMGITGASNNITNKGLSSQYAIDGRLYDYNYNNSFYQQNANRVNKINVMPIEKQEELYKNYKEHYIEDFVNNFGDEFNKPVKFKTGDIVLKGNAATEYARNKANTIYNNTWLFPKGTDFSYNNPFYDIETSFKEGGKLKKLMTKM